MADKKALEDELGEVVERIIRELRASSSDTEDERIWRAAIADYGRLKVALDPDADANENIIHFFAVDGIAFERKHTIVTKAVGADEARVGRWIAQLERA